MIYNKMRFSFIWKSSTFFHLCLGLSYLKSATCLTLQNENRIVKYMYISNVNLVILICYQMLLGTQGKFRGIKMYEILIFWMFLKTLSIGLRHQIRFLNVSSSSLERYTIQIWELTAPLWISFVHVIGLNLKVIS